MEYVSAVGQFAVRGDVVDIFSAGQEFPYRVEYFDDEIEKIISFDFSNMKTQQIVQKVAISPLFLKFGENTVFDLCDSIIVEEPQKIENECNILAKSRAELSWNVEKVFLGFGKTGL